MRGSVSGGAGRLRLGAVALVLAVSGAACGGDPEKSGALEQLAAAKETMKEAKTAASAMKGMGEVMKQVAQDAEEGVTIEPVDFRALRDLLPEQLAGLPRVEATGEKGGAMGMTISKAEATYRGEVAEGSSAAAPSITVTITDAGAMRGMGILGLAAWSMVEVDRETAGGFERTVEYQGHPALEKFERAEGGSGGGIQLLVERRFVVDIEGSNLEFDQIRRALEQLSVKELERMKEVGVTRGG